MRVAFSWLGRRWLDASAFVAVVVLLGLLVHVVRVHRAAYSTQVVVSRSGGLPAFHAIAKSEVTLSRTQTVAGSFAKVEDTLGKYTPAPIAAGTVLTADSLEADPSLLADLNGRSILKIPLKAGVSDPDPRPSRCVSLLVTPRPDAKTTQPVVIKNVVLLGIRHDGDSTLASVALLPDQLTAIGSLLGSANVFVVWPAA